MEFVKFSNTDNAICIFLRKNSLVFTNFLKYWIDKVFFFSGGGGVAELKYNFLFDINFIE